jgi:hypothetical protein
MYTGNAKDAPVVPRISSGRFSIGNYGRGITLGIEIWNALW